MMRALVHFVYWSVGVFLIGASCLSAGDPGEVGPFQWSRRRIVVQDRYNEQTLRVEVWSPQAPQPTAANSEVGSTPSLAPGPFPIVLFSHGFAGVAGQSRFLCEHLATHGYIVAAPDHPTNNFNDLNVWKGLDSARNRPFELRAVLDDLQRQNGDPQSPWFGRWNGRAGVMGHSMGGYTALAMAGAWIDAKSVPPKPNAPHLPKPDYIDGSDPRISAAAAFNPVVKPFLTTESCRRVRTPIFLLGCTLDRTTPLATQQRPLLACLPGPLYFGVLRGGTHFSLVDLRLRTMLPFVVRALNKATIDENLAERLIRQRTTAFFDRHLQQRWESERWLTSGTPELEWTVRP